MQIQLTENGPAMWFLGEPHSLRISLNFANPGPVDLDFTQLTEAEQKKVLVDLEARRIQVFGASYQDLYQQWAQAKKPVPEPSNEVKQHLERVQQEKQENKRFKLEAQRQRQEEKFQERCLYLSKKTYRAIKSATKDEQDSRLFRYMRDIELAKKNPRKVILRYLEEKIRMLQKEVVLHIENDQTELPVPKGLVPEETIQFDVVESEQETIEFPPDAIQKWITGE